MCKIRRIASNEVLLDDKSYHQCVVELEEGRVVNYYCFEDELPLTEWLGGTIVLSRDKDGILRAFQNGNPIE